MAISTEMRGILGDLLLTPNQRAQVDEALAFRAEKCGLTPKATLRALQAVATLQNRGVVGTQTVIPALLAELASASAHSQSAPPVKL